MIAYAILHRSVVNRMVQLFKQAAKALAVLGLVLSFLLLWKLSGGSVQASTELLIACDFAVLAGSAVLLFMANVVRIMDETRHHLELLSRTVVQGYAEARDEIARDKITRDETTPRSPSEAPAG